MNNLRNVFRDTCVESPEKLSEIVGRQISVINFYTQPEMGSFCRFGNIKNM